MYSLAIHLYAFVVALLAPFHKKARLLRLGQWRTNSILREKIDRNAKYIWIHASSLGEFEQGRPLMERIRAERPEYKILLTFFSPSGYEVRKNYDGADVICYLPFDTPFRVKKFLRLANPAMAVFIKYEFWGNYLRELHKRHIPVYIISAIFRREQLFFQWFGAPYRKMLTYFTHLFVQDERSRELLAEYGVTNVTVAGDTRFDRVLEVRRQARELPLIERFLERGDGKRPVVLVAGSSWPQDEALFIPYFHARPEMKLIIAPHEIVPARIERLIERSARKAVRYTQLGGPADLEGADVLIVDTIGILSSVYRYGTYAYIGGGFGVGIHNILEAATFGLPLAFGPNYRKFQEACDLVALDGAVSVETHEALRDWLKALENDAALRERTAHVCADYVATHRGATEIILGKIAL